MTPGAQETELTSPPQVASEADYTVVRWAMREIDDAKRRHGAFRQRATRCWRYWLYGEPEIEVPEPWMSKVKANFLQTVVEQVVAVVTDSRPTATVVGEEESDSPKAEMAENLVSFLWDRLAIEGKLEEYVRSAAVTGLGIAYIGYDPFALGRGEVEVRIVDSRNWLWEGEIVADARWVCEISRVPAEEMRNRFPAYASRIHPDLDQTQNSDLYFPDTMTEVPEAPVLTTVIGEGTGGMVLPSRRDTPGSKPEPGDDYVTVYDMWIRPTESVVDGEPVRGEGRRLIIANQALLEDDTYPFDDYWRHDFPYVPLVLYEVPGLGDPHGIVEGGIPLQREMGELLRLFADHVFEAKGRGLIPQGCDLTPEEMRTPGQWSIWDANATIEKPQILPSPQLTPLAVPIFGIMRASLDVVTGVHAVDRGEAPGEVRAAKAIEKLQGIFERSTRIVSRHLDRAIDQIGNRILQRIDQFYVEPRTIRVLGPTGAILYQTLTPTLGEGGARGPFSGSYFDFRVKTGSTLPPDPEKLIQLGMALLNMGLIDPAEVVSKTPYRFRPQMPQGPGPGQQPGLPPSPGPPTPGGPPGPPLPQQGGM